MGYKQGILYGSSIAMLICNSILLILFISCTSVCRYESTSYYSPLWTSLLGLFMAAFGIGMSRWRKEEIYGGLYLAFCIVLIFVNFACMILVTVATIYEALGEPTGSQSQNTFSFGPRTTTTLSPSSPHPEAAPTPGNTTAAIVLWQVMMVMSGILMVIYIIASCMFCCCQERPSHPVTQETQVVQILTGGQQIGPINNQTFVIHTVPMQPATTITGAHPNGQPPPYHSVVNNQAAPQHLVAPTAGHMVNSQVGQHAAPTPGGQTEPAHYMPLLHSSATAEWRQPPVVTNHHAANAAADFNLSGSYEYPDVSGLGNGNSHQPSEEPSADTYDYIDNVDLNSQSTNHQLQQEQELQNRDRLPTPDEYTDVSAPSAAAPGPPVPPRPDDDNDGEDAEYSYACAEDIKVTASDNDENREYANDSRVQRSNQNRPRQPDYLEILP